MKQLILLTFWVFLFNSCQESEEQLPDEFVKENSKPLDINKKESSLYTKYANSKDFIFAGELDYNKDGYLDFWYVKTSNTKTGYIELHIINPFSEVPLYNRASILRTKFAHDYSFKIGDYNRDGRQDLWAIRKTNAGTNRLEVHIIDGVKNFSTWMTNRVTPHRPLNSKELLRVSDYNGDGWLDLIILDSSSYIAKSVLNGKVKFKSFLPIK